MKMDINFWLGFLGFAATIIFGILSIYLVKSKKYPGGLTFISEQTIGLFDSIIKNFPQIAITYNGNNIDQQIVLLKGFIINSGNVDIKEDMVEEDLKLILPNNYRWLSAKIVDATSGSKASISIQSENEIHFNLGLFRKNEFIRFEALANIPQSTENKKSATDILEEMLEFEHRIADTSKVEKRPLNLDLPNFKKKLTSRVIMPAITLFYLILLAFMIFQRDIPSEFHYHLKSADTTLILTATPKINNTIDLKRVDGSDFKTIPIQEFNSNFQKVEIKEWKSKDWLGNFFGFGVYWLLVILVGCMFILSTIMYIINPLLEYKKIKKLRQSLNLIEK